MDKKWEVSKWSIMVGALADVKKIRGVNETQLGRQLHHDFKNEIIVLLSSIIFI